MGRRRPFTGLPQISHPPTRNKSSSWPARWASKPLVKSRVTGPWSRTAVSPYESHLRQPSMGIEGRDQKSLSPSCRKPRSVSETGLILDRSLPWGRGRASQARTIEDWRIVVGDWEVYAVLGAGVPYETAAKLITALKRNTFTDRRTKPDTDRIPTDFLETLGASPRIAVAGREFEIMTGSGGGFVIRVALVGDRVELLATGFWVARCAIDPRHAPPTPMGRDRPTTYG